MNEFRATPPKDDSALPVPTPKGPGRSTASIEGLHRTSKLPVAADSRGRAPGLAGLAGIYTELNVDGLLDSMNQQVLDSLNGGV